MADDQRSDEQPKIFVDSDWKKQAQAEKDRLAKAAAQSKPDAGQGADSGAEPGEDPNRPVDFIDIIRLLASQALMYLGAYPDPESGKAILAPEAAKAHIDMLSVLQDKTKGNLTDEEAKALNGIVNDLRLQFVEISKAVAKAIEEGKISPSGSGTFVGGAGSGLGGTPPSGPKPGPGMSPGI